MSTNAARAQAKAKILQRKANTRIATNTASWTKAIAAKAAAAKEVAKKEPQRPAPIPSADPKV